MSNIHDSFLVECGIVKSNKHIVQPILLVIILLLFWSVIYVVCMHYDEKLKLDIFVAIATASCGLVVGMLQWSYVRKEKSFEKLYERLDLPNKRLESWGEARTMVAGFFPNGTNEGCFEPSLYVYIQLDNLEYLLEKYQRGFLGKIDLIRGTMIFSNLCEKSAGFAELAIDLVNRGAYNEKTKAFVKHAIDFSTKKANS